MNDLVEIRYTDFCDYPRYFVARHQGRTYLFDASYKEANDEYPDEFKVSVISGIVPFDSDGFWASIRDASRSELGTVRIERTAFQGRRPHRFVQAEVLREAATRLERLPPEKA